MKRLNYILPFFLLMLAGCASTAQLRELNDLKCEKVAAELLELRALSSESSLISLGFALSYSGLSEDLVLMILERSSSKEASTFQELKYNEKLDKLTLKLMEKSGCSTVEWVKKNKQEEKRELLRTPRKEFLEEENPFLQNDCSQELRKENFL